MIKNKLFYTNTKTVYPPFKNGLYLEEHFLKKIFISRRTFSKKNIGRKTRNKKEIYTRIMDKFSN